MSNLSFVLMFLGLLFFGFEYDSGWCFAGAVFMFLCILD